MTSLLIAIKHRCPWIWRSVEWLNGRLFALRYPGLERTAAAVLAEVSEAEYAFAPVRTEDLAELSAFLERQPAERRRYFDPHGFDRKTLEKLRKNRAFAMMKITETTHGRIVGYFFLRGFFVGRAFHGLIVDADHANRGLGTAMWATAMRICDRMGLRMFATIAEANTASLISVRRATEVEVVEQLARSYLLIECKPKQSA